MQLGDVAPSYLNWLVLLRKFLTFIRILSSPLCNHKYFTTKNCANSKCVFALLVLSKKLLLGPEQFCYCPNKMKFRARMIEPIAMKRLYNILQSMTKLTKSCVLRLASNTVSIPNWKLWNIVAKSQIWRRQAVQIILTKLVLGFLHFKWACRIIWTSSNWWSVHLVSTRARKLLQRLQAWRSHSRECKIILHIWRNDLHRHRDNVHTQFDTCYARIASVFCYCSKK